MDFPFDATVAKTGLAKAEDSLPAGEGEHIQVNQKLRLSPPFPHMSHPVSPICEKLVLV